jgi:hypothetical protein
MVAIENLALLSPTTLNLKTLCFEPCCLSRRRYAPYIIPRSPRWKFLHIAHAKTDGPINIVERREEPLITRDFDYENKGLKNIKKLKIHTI